MVDLIFYLNGHDYILKGHREFAQCLTFTRVKESSFANSSDYTESLKNSSANKLKSSG
jgi:hypothetical protein